MRTLHGIVLDATPLMADVISGTIRVPVNGPSDMDTDWDTWFTSTAVYDRICRHQNGTYEKMRWSPGVFNSFPYSPEWPYTLWGWDGLSAALLRVNRDGTRCEIVQLGGDDAVIARCGHEITIRGEYDSEEWTQMGGYLRLSRTLCTGCYNVRLDAETERLEGGILWPSREG